MHITEKERYFKEWMKEHFHNNRGEKLWKHHIGPEIKISGKVDTGQDEEKQNSKTRWDCD